MAFDVQPGTLDEIDLAPVTIRASATAAAAPSAMWAGLADCASWTEWFPGMRECRWTSDAPHGEGSTRYVHVDRFKVNETILAYEPERLHAFRVDDANLPIVAKLLETQELTSGPDGTTITYTQALWPTRLGRVAMPILRRRLEASVTNAVGELGAWAERHG